MKQNKLIITALVVLSVAGSALAFKAKTFGDGIFCDNGAANHFCNLYKEDFTLTDNGATPTLLKCVTESQNATCPLVKIYPSD